MLEPRPTITYTFLQTWVVTFTPNKPKHENVGRQWDMTVTDLQHRFPSLTRTRLVNEPSVENARKAILDTVLNEVNKAREPMTQ